MSSQKEDAILEEVLQKQGTGAATVAPLMTDNRVLARITDGIYRAPGSALRELVANAYDADATDVIIQTDAPRFTQIAVRDNGRGMDAPALVRLITHIGGSTKRTAMGAAYGTTSEDDPTKTLGGRKLIGKIGIGLFSVSQLSRHFQIITKKKGEAFRLVAEVVLNTYSEDDLAVPGAEDRQVSAGEVAIQSIPAVDIDSHGTDIVLLELSAAARDLLSSRELWEAKDNPELDEDSPLIYEFPPYHIGRIDPKDPERFLDEPSLPWESDDEPAIKFRKLYDAVVNASLKGAAKPKLESTLDRYLRTLWSIAMAVPLDYVDGAHPFDLTGGSGLRFFQLSNAAKGAAEELKLDSHERLRSRLSLQTPQRGAQPFSVYFDGVELQRPLRYIGLPGADTTNPRSTPMMFAGKWRVQLDSMPDKIAGGKELSLEGYFLWTPKVIPAEHRGVVVRIADATGMQFDEHFMEYQVAEMHRLSQITAEIFVQRGLDAALNIDRESFNFGHPHAKLLKNWIHRALRQLATAQKRLIKQVRDEGKRHESIRKLDAIDKVVHEKASSVGVEEPVKAVLVDGQSLLAESERRSGNLAFDRERVFDKLSSVKLDATQKAHRERQLLAVAQLLESFGALRDLSIDQQQELLNGIARIVWGET